MTTTTQTPVSTGTAKSMPAATATPTAAATPTATGSTAKRLKVTWVKSAIGYKVDQKRTLKALGFSKLGQTVEHNDTPALRGMLNAVRHLVVVK